MIPFLTRLTTIHNKLIEAVGLVLALGAWGLDWWYVQTAQKALASFEEMHYRISDLYKASDLRFTIQLESAINRSLKDRAHAQATLSESYMEAWHSPEVRYLWWGQALNQLVTTNMVAGNIHRALRSSGRDDPEWLKNVGKELKAVGEKLSPTGVETADGWYMPSIRLENLDQHYLIDVSEQLDHLESRMDKESEAMYQELKRRLELQRRMHSFAFALGSLLIIAAKVLAWRNVAAQSLQKN